MARRSDDKYTPWRESIFGVIGVGSLWGGVGMATGADSGMEFLSAGLCFLVTALCFSVCYWLWLIGNCSHRHYYLFLLTNIMFQE